MKNPGVDRHQLVLGKLEAFRSDPFAVELANRFAIAFASGITDQSFSDLLSGGVWEYRTSADAFDTYSVWVHLALLCMADRLYREGKPNTTKCHPVVSELRDIEMSRQDHFIVETATRFEAAYRTMENFDPAATVNQRVSSFDQLLQAVQRPNDLFVVLATLATTCLPHLALPPRTPSARRRWRRLLLIRSTPRAVPPVGS
jgi:hypothetical protein